MRVDLASPTDAGDFRAHATAMLSHQVQPAAIDWHALASSAIGETFRGAGPHAPMPPTALHSIVPRSFVRLTELVVLHRDPCRFELLYRLLWRLVHEPELAGAHGDADLVHAQAMAQAVRRDILKARKSVRLEPLEGHAGVALWTGWCEPQHRVTELLAEWLAQQHPEPPWVLATPDRCVLWTGRHLLCGPGVTAATARKMDADGWYDVASRLAQGADGPAGETAREVLFEKVP